MKTPRTLSVIALFLWATWAPAGPGGPVGYVNVSLRAGENLIGNPMYGTDYSLSSIFLGVPGGSTITKWDRASGQFLSSATYREGIGWDVNFSLAPTEGAMFYATAPFVNAFIGYVPYDYAAGKIIYHPPNLGAGLHLVSCSVPVAGATFQQVIGRNPAEGEFVRRLDPTLKTYSTATFRSGAWEGGTPGLGLGEAAYFGLVPEPRTSVLVVAGLLALAGVSRGRRRT